MRRYLLRKLKMLITHLKNELSKKNIYINTGNVLIIKFHKRSFHSNFKINGVKHDRLSVNLPCYALVRRKQQISK